MCTPLKIPAIPVASTFTDFVSCINPFHPIWAELTMQLGNARTVGHEDAMVLSGNTNMQEVTKMRLDTRLQVYVEDNGAFL